MIGARPVLELQSVTKVYPSGPVTALEDVTFSVAEGPVGYPELVSVGSNGTDLADRRTFNA